MLSDLVQATPRDQETGQQGHQAVLAFRLHMDALGAVLREEHPQHSLQPGRLSTMLELKQLRYLKVLSLVPCSEQASQREAR